MNKSTEIWQELHKKGYFPNHRCYQGKKKYSADGMEMVNAHFDMTKDKSILDLGCGYGRLMEHLLRVSDHVIGLDIAPEPLNEATKLLDNIAPEGGWDIMLGDGEHIPLPDESVDRVISVCVFQHLPRTLATGLMKEVHRILRGGGRAAILFLSGPEINNDIPLDVVAEHSLQYSNHQIVEMTGAAGFRMMEFVTRPINSTLDEIWLIARKDRDFDTSNSSSR